jgi:hypothetical protein
MSVTDKSIHALLLIIKGYAGVPRVERTLEGLAELRQAPSQIQQARERV